MLVQDFVLLCFGVVTLSVLTGVTWSIWPQSLRYHDVHGHYGVSNHRPLDCLFNYFLESTSMKSPLLGLSEGNPFLTSGFSQRKAFPFHDVLTRDRQDLMNTSSHYNDVIMSGMHLKSPASRLFTQPFIQAQVKEKFKAQRHWPLCRECDNHHYPRDWLSTTRDSILIKYKIYGLMKSLSLFAKFSLGHVSDFENEYVRWLGTHWYSAGIISD